jgi:cytochrome b subunit of formate dehydrogenase
MANQETPLPGRMSSRATHLAGTYYARFTLAQRVEHIVLLSSFTLLALTGLPQKYAGTPAGEWLIQAFGGIERIRIIHHVSAVVIVLMAIYHLLVLTYKTFVLRLDMTMLPGMKDITDAIGSLRFNVGLTGDRPSMPRYSYDEKVEYWAMVWGTVVMALTGFMLWNPILVTKFLPGQFIPAAKAAHGGEAVLAVLAILVWHLYGVHIKLFNKSMFTGRMTEHEMAEEHGYELAQIKAGELRPRPSPEVIRRRARKVMPIAAVVTLVAVGFVYWLATAERTAINTVPPPPPADRNAFVPLPPTLIPAASGQIGKPIPHPVAGREQCDSCHGAKGVKPYPADHAGRPNVSCPVCHQSAGIAAGAGTPSGATSPAGGATTAVAAMAILHPLQGREDCLMCHKDGGLKPVPADHGGRANDTCQTCHQISAGVSGTPQAAATPVAASEGAAAPTKATGAQATPAPALAGAPAGPKPIPHDLAGREKCDACHGPGDLKPYPADHQGRTNDTCTGCHQAASAGVAAPTSATGALATPQPAKANALAGPSIPHDLLGKENCDTCHGPGGLKPYPADHQGRPNPTCTACHKPAPSAGGNGSAGSTAPTVGGTGAAVTHPLAAGFEKCDTCHGTSGSWPYPTDHAGRTNDMCQVCHKPQA